MTVIEQTLMVLTGESHWLTFDDLYSRVQPDCDWMAFVEVLEGLVAQGAVQYQLPCGADVGYYKRNEDRSY